MLLLVAVHLAMLSQILFSHGFHAVQKLDHFSRILLWDKGLVTFQISLLLKKVLAIFHK